MSNESSVDLWSAAGEGLLSGFGWSLLAYVLGATAGGYWGYQEAGLEWGGLDANVRLFASIFVHGLIGVVASSCLAAAIMMFASLLMLLRSSVLIGLVAWAAVGYLWWKGLALGHWVASEAELYEAEPMVIVAMVPMWIFGLLVPTLVINLVGVWVLQRQG